MLQRSPLDKLSHPTWPRVDTDSRAVMWTNHSRCTRPPVDFHRPARRVRHLLQELVVALAGAEATRAPVTGPPRFDAKVCAGKSCPLLGQLAAVRAASSNTSVVGTAGGRHCNPCDQRAPLQLGASGGLAGGVALWTNPVVLETPSVARAMESTTMSKHGSPAEGGQRPAFPRRRCAQQHTSDEDGFVFPSRSPRGPHVGACVLSACATLGSHT